MYESKVFRVIRELRWKQQLLRRWLRQGTGHLLGMCLVSTVALAILLAGQIAAQPAHSAPAVAAPQGVCPPFFLKDEQGNVIDPVRGVNTEVPYSPRQTCGAEGCHDYSKITEGYHFTQGAGEEPTAAQKSRVAWASSPGNFGGSWCSPAPLYRYLSAKQNTSPVVMDMTAYTFVSTCGSCHPGGGSAEYDRDGRRYDQWINDPASGFSDGADNNLDGDYYRANWAGSGVLEADCLLCHLPGYDNDARKKHISSLNYRWAATAGSGLAKVTGSVSAGDEPQVQYTQDYFNSDGTVELPLVRSPQNQACLHCHQQPGWKKRGANYRERTDVHLRAGLRCVDCHPAGSSATDPRISGREEHQIAKGDDPGGLVRNDLDNTMRSCTDCHESGRLGAPLAKHDGLPPLHLDRISCQACHIPERVVMPIQFQAGDVFNPAPRIPKGGKQLWTFYGPDNEWRNHYGYLKMMGYDEKPTELFRPSLVSYKGKIYPGNRIHSAWPGIEADGQSALMQPRMRDVRNMWTSYFADSSSYPALGRIGDDNGDGVPEVNRPDEIDALITSMSQMLADIDYPMENKRVVWVYDDRVYYNGSEYRIIDKEPWEASPYANVHIYNHDIYPAEVALGANGCGDCHDKNSAFFFAAATVYPFDTTGRPVLTAQSDIIGYDGTPREYSGVVAWIVRFFRWLTVVVMAWLIVHIVLDYVARKRRRADIERNLEPAENVMVQRFNTHYVTQHFVLMISVMVLLFSAVFLWALRYPGAPWASSLTGFLGGVEFWRIIHRFSAVLLIGVSAYHLLYSLLHPEGRRDFLLMMPRKTDLSNYWQNLKWRVGQTSQRPRIGRFSLREKFDYWAVFWGTAIMVTTGLVMWFPEVVATIWPTATITVFDAAKEVHAHEALLALLALSVWHMYNVHLRPGRFPGSLFWLHGKITRREQLEEHPAEAEMLIENKR